MNSFRCLCPVLLAAALLGPVPAQGGTAAVYSFAVVPQIPSPEIDREWRPLLARISAETGISLELKFSRSIPEFERDVLNGRPDFAYMNPIHVVKAFRGQGYVPLVRDTAELVGILVVRKDGPIASLADLNGQVLVFPSPGAFAASLYMRALLSTKEQITFTPKYVSTHSNVYRHVALGLAAAGGGVNKTLRKEPQELQDRLRIIYQTPGVASHPVCGHPRLPAAVREAVADAFLRLAREKALQPLFHAAAMPRPVMADYDRDYGPLERLGLAHAAGQREGADR